MVRKHGPLSDRDSLSYILRRPGAALSSASPAWRCSARIRVALALPFLLVLGLSAATCGDDSGASEPAENIYCADEGEECMSCDEWGDRVVECCGELGEVEFETLDECINVAYEGAESMIYFCKQNADECNAGNGWPDCEVGMEDLLLCAGTCEEFLDCLSDY